MKKHILLGCVVGLTAVMLAGCGNGKGDGSSSPSYNTSADYGISETMAASFDNGMGMSKEYADEVKYEEEQEQASAGIEGGQIATNRKLIKTVSMDVETEEFDSFVAQLQSRIGGFGGYIESSSTNNSSYYVNNGRYANYVIRIPADKLEELIGNVTELANVTWKEENVEDITLRYIDVESHKIALQTEQERLLVLMEQAETVEDLIVIESRLSEIRYLIQSYESTLRTYDNQVNYSTLHLAISEVKKLTPQEEPSVWEKIRDGFTENLNHVITGSRDFFIGVVIAIPYLVIWGIVLLLGYWIGRKLWRKWRSGKKWKKWKNGKEKNMDQKNMDNNEKKNEEEK